MGERRVYRAVLAFGISSLTTSAALAQSASRRCWSAPSDAVGAPALWPDQHERVPSDTAAVSFRRLVERLRGSYDFLQVTTEGDSGRFLLRSILELRERPSPPSARVRGLLEAYLTGVEQGFITESPKPPTEDTRRRYIRGYYIPPNRLAFEEMDSTRADGVISFNEGATIYTVTAIDSSGTIRGRWTSGGGFLLRPVHTWAAELLESVEGYFCAWPRR